jgi:hypothetical protein
MQLEAPFKVMIAEAFTCYFLYQLQFRNIEMIFLMRAVDFRQLTTCRISFYTYQFCALYFLMKFFAEYQNISLGPKQK